MPLLIIPSLSLSLWFSSIHLAIASTQFHGGLVSMSYNEIIR